MKKDSRWLKLLVGCVTLFAAGVIYAWSVLSGPFKAEFPAWSVSSLQLTFTLTLCTFCLGGLVSGLLAKKFSVRLRLLVSAVLILTGFTVTGTMNGSIYLLYLGYGILAGFGIGIVYNVVIAATNAWFPDKKGVATGALMMSFGFSALFFSKVSAKMFEIASIGWRNTYLTLGAVIGGVILISAFLVKAPEGQKKAVLESENDVSTKDMLKKTSFWKLFVFFTLLAAVGSTAIGFGKNFFVSVGLKENAAVTVAGLLSILNGLGRLFSGFFYDKAGLRRTQFLTSFVAIAAPLTALIAVIMNAPVVGVIGLMLCAFSYGFSPTVSAAMVGGFYGMKHYHLNFPVLNLVLIPASFVSTLAGRMYEVSGGYLSTFIVLTSMSVVGLIVNLSIKKA
ncbi:MAG: MFS transporter [Clostridia bacterium]|nr:MFS transporter [Clostridia bacterium]